MKSVTKENKPFASDTKPLCRRVKDAVGQQKQKAKMVKFPFFVFFQSVSRAPERWFCNQVSD